MAQLIDVTSYDRISYRVRVLRDGQPVTAVYINDYDVACDWAYTELQLCSNISTTPLWAAVIEEGVRFECPFGQKILFASNGQRRDGLVLDKELLGKVDRDFLFGLQSWTQG